MSSSTKMLPRHNPPKVESDKGSRLLSWLVFLSLGLVARLWIIGLWIFSDLLGDAFEGWVVPALGFVLLPWSTLTYAFMWSVSSDRVAGWEWSLVAVALLVDLVFWGWSRAAFR